MTTLFSAVLAVLVLATLFNYLLTFGVLGRLKDLQKAVGTPGASDPNLPREGDRVGRFEMTSLQGTKISDELLGTGERLMAFFTPECSACEAVRRQLLARPTGLPMIAFVDGSEDEGRARQIAEAFAGHAEVVLTQDDSSIFKAFRKVGYPTLVRVVDGTIAAAGHRIREVMPA